MMREYIDPSVHQPPVQFQYGIPGATCISMPRRVMDSRFAIRYFRGYGIDIGGGIDSLRLYQEFFPLIKNIIVYDKEQGDAQTLSNIEDESFDFLYSSHCLEHMRDVDEAIANWIRVVKPGGYMVISVPDEDLYEQGVFPSKFNEDHKHTFAIAKHASWSPNSINVVDIVKSNSNIIKCHSISTIDSCYRYNVYGKGVDQTRTPIAESAIECIIQKRVDYMAAERERERERESSRKRPTYIAVAA